MKDKGPVQTDLLWPDKDLLLRLTAEAERLCQESAGSAVVPSLHLSSKIAGAVHAALEMVDEKLKRKRRGSAHILMIEASTSPKVRRHRRH